MLELDIQWAIEEQELPSKPQCYQWINSALQGENKNNVNEVTLRFVSPQEIQELNRDFRNMDKATNVLSFPFEQPMGLAELGEELPYLGDIVICPEIVAKEAIEQNKPEVAHWAHMIVHGVLHLQGFDHIEDDEAEEMEALEIQILQRLGFGNPYQDES